MDVVFVTPVLRNGGAERVLGDIANGLVRQGFKVGIISLAHEVDISHLNKSIAVRFLHDAKESLQKGGPIYGKIVRRIRLLRRLKHALQDIPPNTTVIGFLEPSAQYLWLIRLVGGPRYLVSLHAHESTYFQDQFPNPLRRWAEKTLLARACWAAGCVTLPSDGCRRDLIAHFGVPPARVRTIQNPVDLGEIQRRAREAPEKLEVADGVAIFVHAARLVKQKNHKLLVEACKRLRAVHEDFVVLCCGEGSERSVIEAWIAEADLKSHIHLLGQVDNPYALMARARGVVLTSEYESFGLVLVEGMICGAPPIATNCHSGPDEVLRDGAGLLVENNAPAAFSDAMLRLIEDDALHADLCEHGRVKAEKYSVDNIVRIWASLLAEPLT
jgi:glycosyltransferase involved in cell wall biosynthesis